MKVKPPSQTSVSVVDLFCGAGGLSYGFKLQSFRLAAGIDIDEACRYPYGRITKHTGYQDLRLLANGDIGAARPAVPRAGAFRLYTSSKVPANTRPPSRTGDA